MSESELIRTLKKAAVAAFLLLAALLGPQVHASDHIVARGWIEDKTGQLTLDQVRGKQFTPFKTIVALGVGAAPLWVRLTIDPRLSDADNVEIADETYVLKISPIYLDQIELFDPLDRSGRRRITGDNFPVGEDEYRSLTFGFVIPRGAEPRDVYLRIQSNSTRFFYPQVLPIPDLIESDRALYIFSGVFLGVSVLLLAWGLISWLTSGDRLLLAYVGSQFFGLLFGVFVFGYFRLLFGDVFSPAWIDRSLSLSVFIAVGAATYFYLTFFKEFRPPIWGVMFFRFGLLMAAVQLVLTLTGGLRTAVLMNWFYLAMLPVVSLVLIFFCKGWSEKKTFARRLLPRSVLLWYFGALALLYMSIALSGFGVYEQGPFSIYAGLTNSLMSGAIAFAVLQYRVSLNQKTQAELATRLELSEQQIRQEREHRLDQERLMAMLAHELKTPLSVISVAIQTQSNRERNLTLAKGAVRDIGEIIDRCVEADRLQASGFKVQIQAVDLSDLVTDVIAQFPDLGGRLQIELPRGFGVNTDRQLIRSILTNLMDNAVRYSPPDTPISVQVQTFENASGWRLTVRNVIGNVGMPDLERIFEKYYRSAGAHRISGTGIGLYLSHELAEKLGGDLSCAIQDGMIALTLSFRD